MGHSRLGPIPKTLKWKSVVGFLLGEAEFGTATDDIAQIASLSLDAAEGGLAHAADDEGLRFAFYLLAQVALASREPESQQRLEALGVRLDSDSTAFDLASQIQEAIDQHLARSDVRSDLGEMAQQAAGEALARLVAPRSRTLFGEGRAEVLAALREASTKAGFAKLGRTFFSSFMGRFLSFYLSRASASGISSRRLGDLGAVTQFHDALKNHCDQSARIVETFSGDWYSKTNWKEGITPENTQRFMGVAIKKLSRELRMQRAEQ